MKLITIDQARDHVKADGDDDELLTTYCDSAEAVCARLANRSLFATNTDLAAAMLAVPEAMTAAYTAYDAAVEIANAQDDDRIKCMMLGNAQVALDKATNKADADIHGLSLEDADNADIFTAILLTVGHFYRNRENVATGQSTVAIEVPMTAQAIMEMKRWMGPL